MAKKTFVVTHPNLYLKVDGKLKRIKKDSELLMEPKNAASLVKQGKILAKGQSKAVEVGSKEKPKADEKPEVETDNTEK
jgi:hypothetical protein